MSLLRRPASPGRCQKDLAIVRPLGFTQWLPLARPLPQLNIAPVRAAILFPEFVSHLAHTCLMVSMVIGHSHSPLTSTVRLGAQPCQNQSRTCNPSQDQTPCQRNPRAGMLETDTDEGEPCPNLWTI